MADKQSQTSRRAFLGRMTAVGLGAMAARGVYDILDDLVIAPQRAEAATVVRRLQEQYLINNVEVVLDNGVTCAIPPLHNDVFTAKLKSGVTWSSAGLKNAQSRLEKALQAVEAPYTDNAAGLTMVIGWGLPYFRQYVPSQMPKLPVDTSQPGGKGAVLDAIAFPSDPPGVILEDNHVMFKMRSDSANILKNVEYELFDHVGGSAYIGDLFDLTSKRIGFLGRGFGTTSIAKTLALAAGVPGASSIPDRAQLMMGFTSTQTAALGPDNIPSFETLRGVTNQWPSGYFAAGCAMHLSHLFIDLQSWYGRSYAERVARMFSPTTAVPADGTVTLPNGPTQVAANNVKAEAASPSKLIGHNSALQQATRLANDTVDNYGRLRRKGTAVPLREDFNTVDNPFAWTNDPGRDNFQTTGAAGMHFVAFVPASSKFHVARNAMDGVLPTANLRTQYGLTTQDIGINSAIGASHRQNYLIPPRAHRSFPLAELLT